MRCLYQDGLVQFARLAPVFSSFLLSIVPLLVHGLNDILGTIYLALCSI